MTDVSLQEQRATSPRRARLRPVVVAGRLTCALVVLALAAGTVLWDDTYRSFEATGASLLVGHLVGGRAAVTDDIFWVYPGGFVHGFRVTSECTAVLLVAPLLGLTAALFAFTRAPMWRLWLASGAMLAIVTAVNEFRLAFIAFASVRWGMHSGYDLAHVLIGSSIGIVGFAGGFVALLVIGLGRNRPRHLRLAHRRSGPSHEVLP
ncbi:MAG: exosortase/archaeosortase family protein [Marmoricola sp.]